ncbi:hypothetical protein FB99_41290 (plasmid) [Pantoea agglomerans]|nr:hypothetical protein FB99_41290 [Pantoea agglomerans]
MQGFNERPETAFSVFRPGITPEERGQERDLRASRDDAQTRQPEHCSDKALQVCSE